MSKWIKCADTAPPEGEYVIVVINRIVQRVPCYLREGRWYWEDDEYDYDSAIFDLISHWQPFPEFIEEEP